MNKVKTKKKYGSLRNSLILSYLLIGLIPLIFISWFSYQQSKSSLTLAAKDKLLHSSNQTSKFINNWFFYRFTDLNSLAESKNNSIMLKQLSDGFKESGEELSEYVKSYDWMKRVGLSRNDLIPFSRRYGYVYDLFLIDNEGNVLYSVARESDLGTNLFTGFFSNTKFSNTVKQTLKTGENAFSDFERYKPSENILTAFISAPLLDDLGDKIGVFAIQIKLDVLMEHLSGVSNKLDAGDAGDAGVLHQYLITHNGELRSALHGGDEKEILNRMIKLEHYGDKTSSHNHNVFKPHIYIGPNNKEYIGVRKQIKIKKENYFLVSEVQTSEAFSSVNELAKIQILLVLSSIVFIVAFAYFRSCRITSPISELAKVSEEVALGKTDKMVNISSNNEIGQLAESFNHMLDIRLSHEQSLIDSKEKINQALDDLKQQKFALDQHSIVAITDVKGTIIFVNDLFLDISGYSRGELIGKNHRLLKSGLHDEYFFKAMYKQLINGEVFHAEICNKAKDGHLYWVDTTIVPFMDEKGKPESYIAIRTDITNQKQTEEELIKAIGKAEQAVVAKSEFLASMSHEIRTPMNGVLGMLSLLINTELDEDQLHRVKIAQSSGQSLLALINDILDFSKIEADKLDLEIIDFNLRGMLGDFAEAMAYTAQAKNLELVLDVTNVEESLVRGDPSRLRQILTNLVGNSIKFTSDGEIVVRVEMQESDDETLLVCFYISDTGIGIPEEKLEKLFDSFSQVDTSTTRKYGGTGLGLAIAKKLCLLMGGDISVESEKDKGSLFKFSAKLKKSNKSQQVLPKIDIKKLNLLIVDDNATNCEVLRGQLEHWGATVVEAHSGKQAIQICNDRLIDKEANVFDIAFLDMQMPEMDGEELGRHFINDTRFKDMKLVMMTSMGFQDDINKFGELGFSAYFPKPATTSDLFNALAVVAAGGAALHNAVPLVTHEYLQTLSTNDEGEKTRYIWPENSRILLVEDNHVNQLVAQGIINNFGLALDVANNGLEALHCLNESHISDLYDIILMDCQMPEMDGYEATRAIREGKGGDEYKSIPIIAMTANAMQGDKEKCLAAGMSDYLPKPIDSDKLLEKLSLILSNEMKASILEPVTEDDIKNVSDDSMIWDKEDALNRVLGNLELFKTIIEIFIDETPGRMSELQKAVQSDDCDLSSKVVHSIKGVAANVSAKQLYKIAAELEASARQDDSDAVKLLLPELQSASHQVLKLFNNYLETNP
ncbi:MAG: histidine kinase [endosymbiont of Galathealinum brachiosum]|uniref:Sensory/regulatory protein RpfC n=1 Tax=endosymbiont of Galathealinum brachiosum TaxID=2200906 RepID=A0A370DLW3_9GAMM|nr:MAG: histidine kinase [endosymbiont of Galathealinum brachiosum]